MKRFRFRLEKVLHYRSQQEEEAKRALRLAIQRRVQLEHQMEGLRGTMQEAASALLTDLAQIQHRETFLLACQEQLQRLQDALPLLQSEEEKAHQYYLQTHQARETLSRLKTRAYELHRLEAETEQQKLLDEWSQQRGKAS